MSERHAIEPPAERAASEPLCHCCSHWRSNNGLTGRCLFSDAPGRAAKLTTWRHGCPHYAGDAPTRTAADAVRSG